MQGTKLDGLEAFFDVNDGLLTLAGTAVQLRRRLDDLFLQWATEVNAIEYAFPPVLPVASLHKSDYFSAFPHLASLVTRIDRKENQIAAFVSSTENSAIDTVEKNYLTAAHYALPSAACYFVYHHFQGKTLTEDLHITLVAPCFRHEDHYSLGRRQWAFHMREIVCIGREQSVRAFLQFYDEFLLKNFKEIGMPIARCEATDPFFDKRDPRRLVQKLEPVKHEFMFRGNLAIASTNFHRDFFGNRYNIGFTDDEPAFSGCVAFGLERWLTACCLEFGHDWEAWPVALTRPN